MTTLHRPLVRSFEVAAAEQAVAHVRAGGHAVVWESTSRATLVFARPRRGSEDDLGAWAVYDMRRSRWTNPKEGPFAGLSTMRVPRDCLWIVERRIARDAAHEGSTRAMDLGCLDCAACCHDNEVTLFPDDVARFRDAGRGELARPPYARRQRDGRVLLTLLANGRCRHLRRDNACRIYAIRPFPCREFPMGSECCLSARAQVLGLHDGAEPA